MKLKICSPYGLHPTICVEIISWPFPTQKQRLTVCTHFSYVASKIWNSLPDTYKTLSFQEFKQEILRYEAFS